ncbi:MAG TPA: lysylphosphatidylglycerol synthase transmembrane domain-containing protein [Gaiellaceae bacterium]
MATSPDTASTFQRRLLRGSATLVFTGLCVWYLVAKIDFGETAHVLGSARLSLLLLAFAILVLALVPLAWRWQRLLAARGIREHLPWLLRTYFVSYTASQVLPTSLGGDAMRIFETSRRQPGGKGAVAGSVLLERGLGAVATLALGALGFVLAAGRYDVGGYLWLELALAVATAALAVVVFSRRARRPLARLDPLLRPLRLARPLGAVYRGVHGYRDHAALVVAMTALTLVVQAFRILAIWLCGEAVGVDLSPLPYFVMGPMFFLVMLAPFTLNGFALREAFFVSFLGQLGVDADQAFATGFLYFLLALALSAPGAVIWAAEGIGGLSSRSRSRPVQAREAP